MAAGPVEGASLFCLEMDSPVVRLSSGMKLRGEQSTGRIVQARTIRVCDTETRMQRELVQEAKACTRDSACQLHDIPDLWWFGDQIELDIALVKLITAQANLYPKPQRTITCRIEVLHSQANLGGLQPRRRQCRCCRWPLHRCRFGRPGSRELSERHVYQENLTGGMNLNSLFHRTRPVISLL